MRAVRMTLLAVALATTAAGAQSAPDWKAVEAEKPHSDDSVVRPHRHVEISGRRDEGGRLPGRDPEARRHRVKRYESGPGRSILLARLKGNGTGGKAILLESHMDVVPTDPARWTKDPFGAEIADGKMWGRGTIDMKGIGTSYLYAFIMLHRQKVPLTRDVLLMFVPDEEIGGDAGRGLDAEEPLRRARSRVRDRRRGLRQPRHVHGQQARVRHLGRREEDACGSSCAPKGWPATARSRTARTPTST